MFGGRDIYSSIPPLRAPSFGKMFIFAVVNVIAWEGKWQVSWCQVPLSSVLSDEESDGNKVEVNKVRLGQRQFGPCGFLSQSLTSPGRFTTGSKIKRKKRKKKTDKDVSPARAASSFTGAEMMCLGVLPKRN